MSKDSSAASSESDLPRSIYGGRTKRWWKNENKLVSLLHLILSTALPTGRASSDSRMSTPIGTSANLARGT